MALLLCKWFLLATLWQHSDNTIVYHPFYVSVTEIIQNRAEKTLEISCKMFTDDLEKAINTEFSTQIDLLQPKDLKQAQKLVAAYISAHLQLKIDGKPVTLKFVGFEKESGALWSYLQVDQVSQVKHIDIQNDLLYKAFDKQIGILHVTVNGIRKSTKLNCPEMNAGFDF